MKRSIFCSLLALGVAGLASAAGSVQSAQPLLATNAITPGNWRIQTEGMPSKTICLGDILPLLQLQHPQQICSRFTIVDKPDRMTVHYSCANAGWGRTSLLVSTPRLVLVDTQGIARGEPFAYEAEARRIGECDPASHGPR